MSARGYFFIIGAMKAGTTSLFKYLADHPGLCPSVRKEPRIFRDAGDRDVQRAEFLSLFECAGSERWCFEASTAYTKYPRFAGVPARIRETVPDARFVYVVRNPVERTWSHYVHNLAHGRERHGFAEALERRPQYLDVSRYHLQLSQYYDTFPKDRILIQVFEDMVADPVGSVRAICRFLDVDDSYAPPMKDVAYNASTDKLAASPPLRVLRALGVNDVLPWRVRRRLRSAGAPLPPKSAVMTPDLRARVGDALRPDTEAFFQAFGRRVDAWTDFRLAETPLEVR